MATPPLGPHPHAPALVLLFLHEPVVLWARPAKRPGAVETGQGKPHPHGACGRASSYMLQLSCQLTTLPIHHTEMSSRQGYRALSEEAYVDVEAAREAGAAAGRITLHPRPTPLIKRVSLPHPAHLHPPHPQTAPRPPSSPPRCPPRHCPRRRFPPSPPRPSPSASWTRRARSTRWTRRPPSCPLAC